jgi:hypothetical protein
MKAIHDRCDDGSGLPPLDALLVHRGGPRATWPGVVYFSVNRVPDPKKERATADKTMQGTVFWQRPVKECRNGGLRSAAVGELTRTALDQFLETSSHGSDRTGPDGSPLHFRG